ncbi:hypothetical protein VE03_09938 [Pseudogymnoascus sp. 23342-1-I1]|nr:hypothetical protein VE03_09938 [Pseudogymnoascus sp. 23342-1-I1]
MATVNMNCVEFYNPNPKPALKASHAQLTRFVLNKHQLPLQPSKSPSAMSARDVQDNDSFDKSLPLLEELLRPQVPQNHKNVHISKRQLIDESRLLTDATTPNSVYVLGNNQREPLIIEDDSDDESDDEAASIEDQDASENGQAAIQDTASTPSSLFGPSTPRDSEYLNTGCFSKDGQQRYCSELAETTGHDQIHQGVEKSIVDEMRPSPLRERAGGSCDRGSVYDIEDELQQISMDQESQNITDVRGTSSKEKLWEETIEQQHCQQKEQEDEQEDNTEATNETIVEAPLSQVREHDVKPYQKDNEDNDNEDSEDDKDEDGFLKCVRIGRETTYNLEFRLLDLLGSFKPSIGLHISNSTSSGEPVRGSARSRVCARAKGSPPAVQKQRKRPPLRERLLSRPGRQSTYSAADDELLIQLKEDDKLPWDEIVEFFLGRTKGTLQVHYCTKLKDCSQTSKYKKRKGICSSGFSMDLVDPQLRDAPPSTPFLLATADKGA